MSFRDGNEIHESFKFGENFSIKKFCVIEEGVEVGDNITIEYYALLKKRTILGNNVSVDSYVRSSGDNIIEDNVTLRYGCTIARDVLVKKGAFISPNVMTIYTTHKGEVKKQTVIGERAFIGTAAVIGPGIEIGDDVVVGANAYVTKDCLEPGVYVGVPAIKIK